MAPVRPRSLLLGAKYEYEKNSILVGQHLYVRQPIALLGLGDTTCGSRVQHRCWRRCKAVVGPRQKRTTPHITCEK